MKQAKDLLIVFNIFGDHINEQFQIENYLTSLATIQAQIDATPEYSFRVVVSACMVSDKCVDAIKNFNDKISIFRYSERYTCQVTFNKTVLKSIECFNEEYEGYLYFSSGVFFNHKIPPKWNDMFVHQFPPSRFASVSDSAFILKNLVKKLHTKKYGIIQLQVNDDHGYHFLGYGSTAWKTKINLKCDYVIPPGNHANFHVAAVHKSMKDFYDKPVSDIHGFCGMESTLSYCCAAIKKQYLLLGDSCLVHLQKLDNDFSSPGRMKNTFNGPPIGASDNPCRDLFWGRKKSDISQDREAIESGLGYYPGLAACNELDWNGVHLIHDVNKYDNNCLALDQNLKNVVKRLFFTNNYDIIYKDIGCEII